MAKNGCPVELRFEEAESEQEERDEGGSLVTEEVCLRGASWTRGRGLIPDNTFGLYPESTEIG